jgi:tetratricopeptide (TPR) repeat protein
VRRLPLLLAVALAGPGLPAPADAVDPFYENLLTEGQLAFARGDHAGASKRFRIACFGLLEEPTRLADCRTRLALSEARLGHREEFESAFRQILELERRFGAYAEATMPADLRSDFEQQVALWIPEEVIRGVPVFESVVRKRALDRLVRLPPSQKKMELEQLATAEPTEPRWPLELARLAVAERSWLPAQEWAERTLALAAGHDEALCLRGRAAAMAVRCAEALPDLSHCSAPPEDPRLVEDQLGCHLALQDLDGAEGFIASLPPAVQESRTVRRAAKAVAKARQAAERAAVVQTVTAKETSAPSEDPADDTAGGEAVKSEEIGRLRASLLAADDYGTLSDLFRRAEELAEASPDWIEAQRLAGEAAYRTSQWERGVYFLRRARLDGEAPPALLFYLAVSLYESGQPGEAAIVLEQAMPRLEISPLVQSYRERILGDAG